MNRQSLVDANYQPISQWFDRERALCLEPRSIHNGSNLVDVNTQSQWKDEFLFFTAGENWILNKDGSRMGRSDDYFMIDENKALQWLNYNGYDEDRFSELPKSIVKKLIETRLDDEV